MQMVIDIPDDVYNDMKNGKNITNIILNYTPLPKGHGRLVDVSNLDDTIYRLNTEGDAQITRYEYKIIDNVIFEMPTIIEADKENEE